MDWHNFVTSEDAQGIAKWIGVGISLVLAFLGLERWYTGRKTRKMEVEAKIRADLDARFAHKADLSEVEAIHERIRRHREANEIYLKQMMEAVQQLRADSIHHRNVEAKLFDKIEASDKAAVTRQDSVMGLLVQIASGKSNKESS